MTETQTRQVPDSEIWMDELIAGMRAVIRSEVKCDICIHVFGMPKDEANDGLVDGRTVNGQHGFMCREHFPQYSANVRSSMNVKIVLVDPEPSDSPDSYVGD